MRTNLLFFLLLITTAVHAQHNFLGKSRVDIVGFYTLETEFSIKTKRVTDNRILLTVKGEAQYPYYTYELSADQDECISVGIVSKNPEVLMHYRDMLSFWGNVVEIDEVTNTEVFRLENEKGTYRYTVSQPYKNSKQYISRQKIFYILVSKEDRTVHASKFHH